MTRGLEGTDFSGVSGPESSSQWRNLSERDRWKCFQRVSKGRAVRRQKGNVVLVRDVRGVRKRMSM